jgi:hypothetical protein
MSIFMWDKSKSPASESCKPIDQVPANASGVSTLAPKNPRDEDEPDARKNDCIVVR